MSQYARIDNGLVAEFFTPPPGLSIADCFHSDLTWAPCDGVPGIAIGWRATETDGSWTFDTPLVPQPTPQDLSALLQFKRQMGIQFTPTGAISPILFSTDSDAQIVYTAEWSMITATPPLRIDGEPIIAANGAPVALSNADAKALVEKALTYTKSCVTQYATLLAQLQSDPNTDITAGWPSNS
jgi:hypothetical protein